MCVAHAGALIWSKSAAGRDARAARPTSGGFRPAMPLRRMSTVNLLVTSQLATLASWG